MIRKTAYYSLVTTVLHTVYSCAEIWFDWTLSNKHSQILFNRCLSLDGLNVFLLRDDGAFLYIYFSPKEAVTLVQIWLLSGCHTLWLVEELCLKAQSLP